MKRAEFHCANCEHTQTIRYKQDEKIPLSMKCPKCGKAAKRKYEEVVIETENENVSAAISTTLWGTLPSGRDKAII